MTGAEFLPAAVLNRKAMVYIQQSTQAQVQTNLESQWRQYDLVDVARQRGFHNIEVIDEDLGRSASGMVARPGFERLVEWLCAGEVGAVLCFDASRLARNGRDRHHLLELCGLVEARVNDLDGHRHHCRCRRGDARGRPDNSLARRPALTIAGPQAEVRRDGCRIPEEALAVMRTMATRWSDEDIAASLNPMGVPTGQGKSWTAHRVSSVRRVNGIHTYRSAEKNGEWLTTSEAATTLGVTHHRIRRRIKAGILPGEQVVPGAPYQIGADDLQQERVAAAIGRTGRPCRIVPANQLPMLPDT
jgi:hypothetical protein